MGQLGAAVEAFYQAASATDSYDDWMSFATVLQQQGNHKEALQALSSASSAALTPEHALTAASTKASVLIQLGRPRKALKVFKGLEWELQPSSGRILAQALRGAGKSDQAIKVLQRVALLQPSFASQLDLAQQSEQPSDARSAVAAARSPQERAAASVLLARTLASAGHAEEAAAALEQAVSGPATGEVWGRLGSDWMTAGNLDRAENCFTKAVADDPNKAAHHGNLVCKQLARQHYLSLHGCLYGYLRKVGCSV